MTTINPQHIEPNIKSGQQNRLNWLTRFNVRAIMQTHKDTIYSSENVKNNIKIPKRYRPKDFKLI